MLLQQRFHFIMLFGVTENGKREERECVREKEKKKEVRTTRIWRGVTVEALQSFLFIEFDYSKIGKTNDVSP